jgi:hypothetical protein
MRPRNMKRTAAYGTAAVETSDKGKVHPHPYILVDGENRWWNSFILFRTLRQLWVLGAARKRRKRSRQTFDLLPARHKAGTSFSSLPKVSLVSAV